MKTQTVILKLLQLLNGLVRLLNKRYYNIFVNGQYFFNRLNIYLLCLPKRTFFLQNAEVAAELRYLCNIALFGNSAKHFPNNRHG